MFTADMIKIMQHYVDGGEIEFKEKSDDDTTWRLSCPSWDWETYEYRIKEEKQKIVIEKWLLYDKSVDVYFEARSSDIDKMLRHPSNTTEKVKLLESYEVEL